MQAPAFNKTFYIVFTPLQLKAMPFWWRPFAWFASLFNKKFGHAKILWAPNDQTTTILTAVPWTIRIINLDRPIEDCLNDFKTAKATACISYQPDYKTFKQIPCGFPTCVTIIKAMLGIKSPLIITPKRLFSVLKKKGLILWENQ